eukprot:Opistho-2@85391
MQPSNFEVSKLNRKGYVQSRILQIDYEERTLKNLKKGKVQKQFSFADVVSQQKDAKHNTKFFIFFKNRRPYELFASTSNDRDELFNKIQHIINSEKDFNDFLMKRRDTEIKVIKSGPTYKKGKIHWAKRRLVLLDGLLSVYRSDKSEEEEGHPLNVINLKEVSASRKGTHFLAIRTKLRPFEFRFDEQADRDAWYNVIAPRSRKNDETRRAHKESRRGLGSSGDGGTLRSGKGRETGRVSNLSDTDDGMSDDEFDGRFEMPVDMVVFRDDGSQSEDDLLSTRTKSQSVAGETTVSFQPATVGSLSSATPRNDSLPTIVPPDGPDSDASVGDTLSPGSLRASNPLPPPRVKKTKPRNMSMGATQQPATDSLGPGLDPPSSPRRGMRPSISDSALSGSASASAARAAAASTTDASTTDAGTAGVTPASTAAFDNTILDAIDSYATSSTENDANDARVLDLSPVSGSAESVLPAVQTHPTATTAEDTHISTSAATTIASTAIGGSRSSPATPRVSGSSVATLASPIPQRHHVPSEGEEDRSGDESGAQSSDVIGVFPVGYVGTTLQSRGGFELSALSTMKLTPVSLARDRGESRAGRSGSIVPFESSSSSHHPGGNNNTLVIPPFHAMHSDLAPPSKRPYSGTLVPRPPVKQVDRTVSTRNHHHQHQHGASPRPSTDATHTSPAVSRDAALAAAAHPTEGDLSLASLMQSVAIAATASLTSAFAMPNPPQGMSTPTSASTATTAAAGDPSHLSHHPGAVEGANAPSHEHSAFADAL